MFLDFFYKSKDGFHPLKQWTRPYEKPLGHLGFIQESKEPTERAGYWVESFEKEKKDLLMFNNWGTYAQGMEQRETTGWFARISKDRDGDIFPYGAVINQLRDHYGLERISGEYDLGIQETNRVAYAKEKELEAEIQKLKTDILAGVQAKSVSEEEEKRVDPTDGKAYTKRDFVDVYDGTAEWDAAKGNNVCQAWNLALASVGLHLLIRYLSRG